MARPVRRTLYQDAVEISVQIIVDQFSTYSMVESFRIRGSNNYDSFGRGS